MSCPSNRWSCLVLSVLWGKANIRLVSPTDGLSKNERAHIQIYILCGGYIYAHLLTLQSTWPDSMQLWACFQFLKGILAQNESHLGKQADRPRRLVATNFLAIILSFWAGKKLETYIVPVQCQTCSNMFTLRCHLVTFQRRPKGLSLTITIFRWMWERERGKGEKGEREKGGGRERGRESEWVNFFLSLCPCENVCVCVCVCQRERVIFKKLFFLTLYASESDFKEDR